MPYIASTMSTDVNYCFYGKTPTGSNEVRKSILVSGKANVADRHFITKDGAVTRVSNEELALLKEHPVFKMHEANGFVKVCATESRAENVKELSKKTLPLLERPMITRHRAKKRQKPRQGKNELYLCNRYRR